MDFAPGGRLTATAACRFCAWRAKLTGDWPIEIGTMLRKLIIEHADTCHPDRFTAALLDDDTSSFSFKVKA